MQLAEQAGRHPRRSDASAPTWRRRRRCERTSNLSFAGREAASAPASSSRRTRPKRWASAPSSGLERYIRRYRNGRDLTDKRRAACW
ncbi:MAG: hypothetical protein MZV65_38845 [Chromatiales bacterium]|nr:hypothetical protein [Chromatiales bacterium]